MRKISSINMRISRNEPSLDIESRLVFESGGYCGRSPVACEAVSLRRLGNPTRFAREAVPRRLSASQPQTGHDGRHGSTTHR